MSQPPYIQKVTPCECGSTEPYWHGPADGLRIYCCDACWEKKTQLSWDANGSPVSPS